MIRIAIVDDDEAYRQQLQEYLRRYAAENEVDIRITVFTDGDEIALNYRAEYDLILLDIEMKFMDGMTAAEHIRELDAEVMLIFITNMAQYAIRGYSVGALDYILKPVTYFAFSEKLKRALLRLPQGEKKYITLQVAGNMMRLPLDDIYYIESFKHYLILYAKDGTHRTLCTMKEMEANLAEEHFFRCNNGYLVNLAHVKSVTDNMVTVGEQALQISRPRRKDFMEALTRYMGGGM